MTFEELEQLHIRGEKRMNELEALAKKNEELLFQILGGIQSLVNAVQLHESRISKFEKFEDI